MMKVAAYSGNEINEDTMTPPAILVGYNPDNNEIIFVGIFKEYSEAGNFIYCTDNIYKFVEDYGEEISSDIKGTNKWYRWGGSNLELDELYEGGAPITEEELSNMTKCVPDEYLKGLINSFNN